MGDCVDLRSTENLSSDKDTVSSSEIHAVLQDSKDDMQAVPDSNVSFASVEAGGSASCSEHSKSSNCNSDDGISSSCDDLLHNKSFHEEPDSTVLEISKNRITDSSDSSGCFLESVIKDNVADGPDSTDFVEAAKDCDGPDSTSSTLESAHENTDHGPDSSNSVLESSCNDTANSNSVPYDNIMDVCSTAAQQIKRTITEALKSREAVSEKLLEPEDLSFSFEANLKEKIADFEKTIEKTNSPTKTSDDTSVNSDSISSEQGADYIDPAVPLAELDIKNTSSEPNSIALTGTNVSTCTNSDPGSSIPELKSSNEAAEIKPVSISEVLIVPEAPVDSEKSKRNQKSSAVKKKGEKSVDQILKSLSNCSSPEEKLSVLCRKHIEVLEDLRSAETRLKQCERQTVVTLREKEQLQADHNRTILAKSRLESLCRELQRQNKAVKEESLLRIREEEEKRKDVAGKFQTTLNDISNLMQDNSKKNLQLREENAELAKKLKSLVDHYEMWEKHMGKVLQQKDLEVQLAKAKLAKTNLQLKQETEKFLREKKDLLESMSELQKKCTELASNEVQLRTELSVYTSKYEEFQSMLNKSNQVFASFKTDMDTTSKKIKKLEKETNIWKTKWENSNGALLEMIADKQKRDKELLNSQQRVLMLEKLCRALQAERNDLQNQVKELSNADDTVSNTEEIQTAQ